MTDNRIRQVRPGHAARLTMVLLLAGGRVVAGEAPRHPGYDRALRVKVDLADGKYSISNPESGTVALRAGAGVKLDGHWLHGADYSRRRVESSPVEGNLGQATEWRVTYFGINGQPDLVYHLRAYLGAPFGEIQVTIRNTTEKTIHVESIRCLDATEGLE